MDANSSEGGNKKKIEFPEIEAVKDEETPSGSVVNPRAGLARKRFTSIAVKVMSQIYQNKNVSTIEEEPVTQEVDKTQNTGDKNNADTNKNPVTKSPQAVRKISRVGSRNKFASLVRLAKYKKMVQKAGPDIAADETTNKTNDEQEKIEMPVKPRFSATLSPEAQYAMLKGYEDLLLNNLKAKNKHSNKSQDGTLYRVKTPHHKVASLHLNGLEEEAVDEEEVAEGRQNEFEVKRAWDVRPAPYCGQLYRIDSKDNMGKTVNRRDTNKSLLPRKSNSEDGGGKTLPKDKQLLLTHRFHCAMDILDTMKESQGVMATSPRYKQRTIKPVDHYNSWSKEWSREFKLEYR